MTRRRIRHPRFEEIVQTHAVRNERDELLWSVHTHDMIEYSQPDLEIRDVPLCLVPDAVRFLYDAVDMWDETAEDDPVDINEVIQIDEKIGFRFVAATELQGGCGRPGEPVWLIRGVLLDDGEGDGRRTTSKRTDGGRP